MSFFPGPPNPQGSVLDPDWRTAYPERLLALVTGQRFGCDPASAEACLAHLSQFDTSGTEGPFGPAVPVGAHAPALDRIIVASGRDPGWSPA